MPRPPSHEPHHVVIAGAGVAGLECVLALHELAGDAIATTVLDPAAAYVEQAWAPAEVVWPGRHPAVPFAQLLAGTAATHRRDALAAVEPAAHVEASRTLAALRGQMAAKVAAPRLSRGLMSHAAGAT